MSERPTEADVEALAKVVDPEAFTGGWDDDELRDHAQFVARKTARAVLDSDWLAAHDAEVRREHGERIAQVIEARNIAGHGAGCLCIVCEAFAECALLSRQGGE